MVDFEVSLISIAHWIYYCRLLQKPPNTLLTIFGHADGGVNLSAVFDSGSFFGTFVDCGDLQAKGR